VARWLKDMQALQSSIRESMQECWFPNSPPAL
jgi:hypothetical protein